MLFRFRNIDKNLIDSLVKSTLYFAHPKQLNDPFDCRVDIRAAAESALLKLSGSKKENLSKIAGLDGYFDKIQKDVANAGVCSFSVVLDNSQESVLESSLLWSHYANNHRGLCLTYDFPEPFINDRSNEITGIPDVEYGDSLLTYWFVDNVPGYNNLNHEAFTTEIIKKALTIKSSCWEYEREVRIIRRKRGTLEISKKYLTQICFGLDTSESDIDLIRKLVDDSGYRVGYCKMVKGKGDFGFKATEIE